MVQATSLLFLVIAAVSVNAGPLKRQAAADPTAAAIAALGTNTPPVINQAASIAIAGAAADAAKLASASAAAAATTGANNAGAGAAAAATTTAASTSGLKPDPAGAKNVGNGNGGQFITGQCLSNADCASACCATLGSIGICSGPGAQFQQGKTGCGFGGSGAAATSAAAGANNAAAGAAAAATQAAANTGSASGLKPDPAGAKNVGNGNGGQFITGQCLSNADCASACCATLGSIGICSGPGAQFQQGKTGCGFNGGAAAPAATTAAAANNAGAGAAPAAAPAKAPGNAQGFVTSPCTQDSDCQQGCCAFNTGKCAGPAIAQTRDGGCGFGNAAPNCNVAALLKLNQCAAGAVNGDLTDPTIVAAAKFVSQLDGIPFSG